MDRELYVVEQGRARLLSLNDRLAFDWRRLREFRLFFGGLVLRARRDLGFLDYIS